MVAFSLMFLVAVTASATADLQLILNPAPDERIDPGGQGKTITAQSSRAIQADGADVDSSEFSAGIVVR